MRDFTVSDFDIRIAGRKRSAVSATRLHYEEGKDVVVKVADELFAAKHYMWRSPIRRSVSLPGGK